MVVVLVVVKGGFRTWKARGGSNRRLGGLRDRVSTRQASPWDNSTLRYLGEG